MKKLQFRILYREFLLRIVDLELLSKHAEGDSRTLLGQFVSLLIFCSLILAVGAGIWAGNIRNSRVPALMQITSAWTMEHFLIATTMLAVGLFAVLSWESMFPDRRDVLVLGPLPVRARTLFLAKVAAVASAVGLTLASLHVLAGIAWPLVLAHFHSAPTPALVFDAPLPPVKAEDFPAVMNRDMAPMARRLDLAAADGTAGIVIGISEHGKRRLMTCGAAKSDSLFEIGSITKTFTGLLLAQMAVEGKLDLRDPVRDLLPPGAAAAPRGFEITLLDLATHHSGLPFLPDNGDRQDAIEMFTNYHPSDLYAFIKRHGVEKPINASFVYSNTGFAVLGAALENRAHASYAELLKSGITGPLGMNDTTISLSPDQLRRLMQGHDGQRQPTSRWDLDAFASAGGIRSTGGDMLAYLEAQLHPEKTPFRAALIASQRFRDYVTGDTRVALAWTYNPERGVYEHGGLTGGFTSFAFFDPRRDFGAVGMMNAVPATFPFVEVLAEHVRERLTGAPALSLAPVSVASAGPLRCLFAYWIAIVSAGVFIFCCVLAIEGFSAQFLPRRWFLRASAFLQLAIFSLLVSGYFLQRSPMSVLIAGPQQPWLAWIPSYWFVGLYQQLSGSLHPALAPLAQRAWIGLVIALCATALAYAMSYLRTMRKIVEEPDIAPAFRSRCLPHFGGSFETAIAQFSVRTLLRSRQHRMIFSFYLGAGFAFATLFLKAPPEMSGSANAGAWSTFSIPLLASTMILMIFWVIGARVVFSLPLDLRANWIFRIMPFAAGPPIVRTRRYALLTVSVLPVCAISAAILFFIWPWTAAAEHLAVLACVGMILAEFTFEDVQRIPFACSYLPGRSRLHLTFWAWILLVGLIPAVASKERAAFERPITAAALLACLAAAVAASVIRNNLLASSRFRELRFEEIPSDRLLSLNLS